MTNEEIITDYMRLAYSDEQLAALLAHAEDGQLAYASCCCFAGIPTAAHALRGANVHEDNEHWEAQLNEGYTAADSAYVMFGYDDAERRAKLIPLIKAEMARREQERSIETDLVAAGAETTKTALRG